jgi:hypothetical protein
VGWLAEAESGQADPVLGMTFSPNDLRGFLHRCALNGSTPRDNPLLALLGSPPSVVPRQ